MNKLQSDLAQYAIDKAFQDHVSGAFHNSHHQFVKGEASSFTAELAEAAKAHAAGTAIIAAHADAGVTVDTEMPPAPAPAATPAAS